jgi:selenocysteine lyase/cysteine desulfurase
MSQPNPAPAPAAAPAPAPAAPVLSRRSFVTAAAAASIAVRRGDGVVSIADDPLGVRADFPVVRNGVYLNSAYITPVPNQVVEAGRAFLESKALQPISLGEMLAKTDQVRAQFARLIGAGADEIGFLFATSEGENVVANALDLSRGDNVVIDQLHYETEFVLYRHLADTRGVDLRVAPARDGRVGIEQFTPLVDRRTKLVSVAWVSHQNGYRHELRPIADLAHAHGALFYTDAIQAVGMFPVDVRAAGVDFLCSGTYKWLLGGFGVAPFFIRRELADRIRLDRFGALHVERELEDGRFQLYRSAKRYDYATLPFAEIYQLGAGLSYLERVGIDRIEAHTVGLAVALRAGLAAQGKQLLTPEGNRSSIVTFTFESDPALVKAALAAAGIAVTVRDRLRQVRVSPALFNVGAEVDRFLEAAARIR